MEHSGANVRTFKGLALAASGGASVGVTTYEPPLVEDGLGTANIVDVSVVGDIAFATGDEKTSSAKAEASAIGFTFADGLVDDESLSTSHSNASGSVSGTAESKSISDPLTASLIASVSVANIDPLVTGEDESVFGTSLIASASFAADDYGKASGSAVGDTAASNSRTR